MATRNRTRIPGWNRGGELSAARARVTRILEVYHHGVSHLVGHQSNEITPIRMSILVVSKLKVKNSLLVIGRE